jgi:hypothetical protein
MVDVTGKQDAIAMKDEFQKALNHLYFNEIESKVKWLLGMNHKLKDNLGAIQKYKRNIVADEDEKKELYKSLNNLLVKETDFEKK